MIVPVGEAVKPWRPVPWSDPGGARVAPADAPAHCQGDGKQDLTPDEHDLIITDGDTVLDQLVAIVCLCAISDAPWLSRGTCVRDNAGAWRHG